MAEHRRNDHPMHSSAPELCGNGVTHVMQPRRGMQPGFPSEALEGMRERVRMQEGAIAALAYQRHRRPLVIERIAPTRSEKRPPLKLLSAIMLT